MVHYDESIAIRSKNDNYVDDDDDTMFADDPTTNLVCAHLIWFGRDCKTSPRLLATASSSLEDMLLRQAEEVPHTQRAWFQNWRSNGFDEDNPDTNVLILTESKASDQAFMQAIYFKTLLSLRVKWALLTSEQQQFVEAYMRQTATTLMAFLRHAYFCTF